jgi:hypothetical protein
MKLISLFLFISSLAYAAPQPVTTSSVLTDPEKGMSFRSYGFKLSLDKINWRPLQRESETLFTEIDFQKNSAKDKNPNAQISLRMDELSKAQNIETYAKKWMRDYPHYGFEVLGTKTFAHSGGQGVVVDILHRPNNKQLRQVILLKNKKVVILTCSDDKSKFAETLVDCNQLVKNFTWLSSTK